MGDKDIPTDQIIATFKQMKAEQSAILSKIQELDGEANEHNLVLSTIEKLEPERKCFRLVGGVLVERTVGEVAPAVQRNRDWLVESLKSLETQHQQKTKTLNEFVTKYNIQVKSQSDLAAAAAAREASNASASKQSANAGVLV